MTRTEYEHFTAQLYTEIRDLIASKNADYADEADPFINFKQASEFGVDPLVGLFVRMGDKFQRLKAFSKHGQLQVKGEGVDDSLRDLIGYCTLALAMIEDRKNG